MYDKLIVFLKTEIFQYSDEIIKRMQELGFAILRRKETTLTTDVAEQFYRDQKDKPYFSDLIQHITRSAPNE